VAGPFAVGVQPFFVEIIFEAASGVIQNKVSAVL
ncbi:uncharacterized protein METZ01_LOCUS440431, partial [marine metagenome]